MVTERFNLPKPEDPANNGGWAELALPFPGFSEGEKETRKRRKKDKKTVGVLPVSDEVMWDRTAESGLEPVPTTPPPIVPVERLANEGRPAMAAEATMEYPNYAVEAPAPVPNQHSFESGGPALSKSELLRVAKTIKIDGIRLKDVFEAGRIDEEGLRAIVAEYLRGGDARQQLTRELVARERSYERDPTLRHVRQDETLEQSSVTGDVPSSPQRGPEPLKTTFSIPDTTSTIKPILRRAIQTAREVLGQGIRTIQRDVIDNSNATDWISITAVVVLWSIILVLLLG